MPTNKKAQLRYQILDRCFSNRHRKYKIEDLVNAVNEVLLDLYGTEVSVRQIRDDIKYMRDRMSYNAPIKAVPFAGNKCYYCYSDPNFSVFKNKLTTDEICKLISAIEMLGRYRGRSNGWLEEVISNLELRFGIKGSHEYIVSFEQNDQLKGLEYLSAIIDSALNHQPLNLLYRTYSGKEMEVVIHPYHVKQYNNRWFLFGLEQTPNGDRIANRPLDRIVKFSNSNVDFIPNTSVDFARRFDDVVGVSIPEDGVPVEKIVLKFDAERFPYVVSKPMHRSQMVLSEDDCIFQIQVRPNKELESVIFSYFPHVEVLAPIYLREMFKDKLINNIKKYDSVQKGSTNEI